MYSHFHQSLGVRRLLGSSCRNCCRAVTRSIESYPATVLDRGRHEASGRSFLSGLIRLLCRIDSRANIFRLISDGPLSSADRTCHCVAYTGYRITHFGNRMPRLIGTLLEIVCSCFSFLAKKLDRIARFWSKKDSSDTAYRAAENETHKSPIVIH